MSLPDKESGMLSKPAIEALTQLKLRQQGPARLRQPVAMIGPGDGGERECAAARAIAGHLAGAGVSIVCGGRGGVMAAASQGAAEAGGIAIGLLPEEDLSQANPWLTVALPTGIGEMRNALVARSAVCLIAVGGNLGTTSEIAMGLKWNKPVFTLHGDLALPGAVAVQDVDEMVDRVAHLLADPSFHS
jgi:uncharacterized protein (TIGR00725 family)